MYRSGSRRLALIGILLLIVVSVLGLSFLNYQSFIRVYVAGKPGFTLMNRRSFSSELSNALKETNWQLVPIDVYVSNTLEEGRNYTGGWRNPENKEVELTGVSIEQKAGRLKIWVYISEAFPFDKNKELRKLLYTGILYYKVLSQKYPEYTYQNAMLDGFTYLNNEDTQGFTPQKIL